MWLFSLLPDFVYHVLLIIGIGAFAGSYLLKMIPFFMQNAFMIRVASLLLIIFCVWVEGGLANESKWQAKVHALEIKVAEAEKRALEANGKIETVYVDRVQVVTDTKVVIQNNIRKSAIKMDQTCRIEPGVIDILNEASKIPTVNGDKK